MTRANTQHSCFVASQTVCGARSVRGWRKTRRNGILSAFGASFITPPRSPLRRVLGVFQRPFGAFCARPSRASGTLAPTVSRGRRGEPTLSIARHGAILSCGRRGAPLLPIARYGAILSCGRRGAPTLPVGSRVPRDRSRLFGRFVSFVFFVPLVPFVA